MVPIFFHESLQPSIITVILGKRKRPVAISKTELPPEPRSVLGRSPTTLTPANGEVWQVMTKTAAARRIPSMPVFFSVPYCPSLAFLSVKIKSPAFVYLHGIKTGVLFICSSARVSSFSPCKFFTIFLRKRQLHRKFNHILRAPCLYRTAVQLHYLPGNGQAQPNTAAAAPCSIQPVELLKDTGKLLLWYWYRRGS